MEAKSLQWGWGLGGEKGERVGQGGDPGRGGAGGESILCYFSSFLPITLKKEKKKESKKTQ